LGFTLTSALIALKPMATAPRVVWGNPTPTTPSYRFGAGRFHNPNGSDELFAVLGLVVTVVDGFVEPDPPWCLLTAADGRGETSGDPGVRGPVTAMTIPATTKSPRTPSAATKRFDIG
jgi:hypothetical protein